jgi:predicted CXXCH cytochrome family protein
MRTFGGTKGACQYCHAPHLWNPSNLNPALAPLWNRNAPLATAITVRAGAAITEVTRACLSCHDGVTQLGAMVNNADAALVAVVPATAATGVDLLGDHPVGAIIPATAEYVAPPAVFVLETGATVGCSTCHDVHNQGTNPTAFLVTAPGVDICAQCHVK